MDEARVGEILAGAEMTNAEAVGLLADLAAKYQGTLADHRLLQAAIAAVTSDDSTAVIS